MMARECAICQRQDRGSIEAAILARMGAHSVAEWHPGVSKVDILEHQHRCLVRAFKPLAERKIGAKG